MLFKLSLSMFIIFSKKSFSALLSKCFFIRSGKKFNSSPPKTFGWLDSICSTRVVPDLGIPRMNIGVESIFPDCSNLLKRFLLNIFLILVNSSFSLSIEKSIIVLRKSLPSL